MKWMTEVEKDAYKAGVATAAGTSIEEAQRASSTNSGAG